MLSELAIVNNLQELVGQPTDIPADGAQTYIDLMITNQTFINVEVIPHPERQSKHLIIHLSIPCIKGKYGNITKLILPKLIKT